MICLDTMTAAALLQGMYWKRGWHHMRISVNARRINVTCEKSLHTIELHPELALYAAQDIWRETSE